MLRRRSGRRRMLRRDAASIPRPRAGGTGPGGPGRLNPPPPSPAPRAPAGTSRGSSRLSAAARPVRPVSRGRGGARSRSHAAVRAARRPAPGLGTPGPRRRPAVPGGRPRPRAALQRGARRHPRAGPAPAARAARPPLRPRAPLPGPAAAEPAARRAAPGGPARPGLGADVPGAAVRAGLRGVRRGRAALRPGRAGDRRLPLLPPRATAGGGPPARPPALPALPPPLPPRLPRRHLPRQPGRRELRLRHQPAGDGADGAGAGGRAGHAAGAAAAHRCHPPGGADGGGAVQRAPGADPGRPGRGEPERGGLHPLAAEGDGVRGAGGPAGQGGRAAELAAAPGRAGADGAGAGGGAGPAGAGAAGAAAAGRGAAGRPALRRLRRRPGPGPSPGAGRRLRQGAVGGAGAAGAGGAAARRPPGDARPGQRHLQRPPGAGGAEHGAAHAGAAGRDGRGGGEGAGHRRGLPPPRLRAAPARGSAGGRGAQPALPAPGETPRALQGSRWARRWLAGTALCCAVLLVGACNAAGVALGAGGLRRRGDGDGDGDGDGSSEAGACLLQLGAGLAFLAAGLLSLLVFATFLVGGNVQTLLCRSWANRELYRFLDTPGNLPPSMDLGRRLNLRRGYNLSAAYHACRGGAGLWEVLQLNGSYALDEHLQASKYVAGFQKRLGAFSARLGEVRLLGAEDRRDLQSFAAAGADRVDYGRFRGEMQLPVVRTSLAGLASALERLQRLQRNGTVAGRLAAEAQALRRMHNSTVRAQEALVAELGESVRFLSALAPHLQARVNETLAATASLEAALPAQAQRLLRQELGCFARKELGYVARYLHWVGQTLREEVASCQPLATALDNGRVILCDRIADPWNAFWFSLGCCTLCLVPSIVFALRLAEHLRPPRSRLISTGSEETCALRIPRVTALKL